VTFDLYERDFDRELQRYGVTDFRPSEFATETGGVPEMGLWDNAMPTIVRIQRFRSYIGKPIVICTRAHGRRGYRDFRANDAVGGASGSIHMRFNAFDCTVLGLSVSETVEAMDRLFPERDRDLWGRGVYTASGFVHWDTRGLLGEPAPARWAA
jgi:hypothetical protein